MKPALRAAALAACAGLAACSVNPVTGERNFQLYGTDWEQQVGAQMYTPLKQSQGGDFILDPELTAYVQDVGGRLAEQARRNDELQFEFSVLNDSTPNAWALPGGKIVVNRGLLTQLDSEAELAAVLGHEIVHADAAHGARQQSKGVLTQVGTIVTMVVIGTTIDDPAGQQVAMIVPALGAQLLTQKYGRDAEREADEYGMRYLSEAGYDPQGAVHLQETFVKLSKEGEQDWVNGLFASHPPSRERVRNNIRTAGELPEGGETGKEIYQQKIAYLKRVEPAYEAYDEARKALAGDQVGAAQEKINRALAIEPRESLFHDLQGDIHALNEDNRRALASYRKAVNANPGFFYGYLRQGQIQYMLDQPAPARSSLSKSLELLPTAEAHYLLGMLDKRDGNLNGAMEHFQAAAGTESEAARNAMRELVLADVQHNPGKYIASRLALDDRNRVWIQFGNRTGVPLTDIEFRYAWLDEQGRTHRGARTFSGTLAAEAQDRIELDVTVNSAADLGRRVQAEITGASVSTQD